MVRTALHDSLSLHCIAPLTHMQGAQSQLMEVEQKLASAERRAGMLPGMTVWDDRSGRQGGARRDLSPGAVRPPYKTHTHTHTYIHTYIHTYTDMC